MILEFILKIQRELLLTTESLPKNYGESLSEKLYQTAHIRNAFAVAFSTIASLGIQQRLTSKSCTCTLIISHLVKYFWSTQVTSPMSITTAEKKLSVSMFDRTLLEKIAELGLVPDAFAPFGIDPHSLDALLHGPCDVRLCSALEKLLHIITLFISGELQGCPTI
jgi:hypothetical protein